ncbi:MAG: hypothetical protein K1000chlam1_01396 [Candidatus Anoxychlamydiales bacterium]|nr:hypothetical protein [Candidatus Anoxychlamydiales bacterium]
MHAPEAINSSLATLYFAYNIHFTDFFKDHEIFQKFISQTQTFDLQIKGIEDIRILTENSLVAAFRTHSITLDEALIKHFKLTNRTGHKNDPLIYPIRKFLHELRCANAHMSKTLHKLTWDIGEKTPKPKFFFDIYLP